MERSPNVNWKLVDEIFGPEIIADISLFAFWPYDKFPYVLSGEASKMDRYGRVYVNSYQAWFKPMRLLPIEVGLKMKEQLRALENEYNENLHNLEDKYRSIAQTFFSELKIK